MAPRASCEGYLTLRTSPTAPPPMVRRYCFLIGTGFYYYSTQDDAYHMMRLRGEVDVIGVQEWDGRANTHIYQNGFLFATAQNKVFYCYGDTAVDKEKWLRAMQTAIETTMPRLDALGANSDHSLTIEAMSPSPVTEYTTVGEADETCKCPNCTVGLDPQETVYPPMASPGPASTTAQAAPQAPSTVLYRCNSCDGLFCAAFTTHKVPLPQRSMYYAKKVCDRCYDAQTLVNYLKAIVERLRAGICIYPRPLNPDTPVDLIKPTRHTPAAEIAITMLTEGAITADECETILRKDRQLQDHNSVDEPEVPLDIKILALHREFRSKSFGVYRAVILLHRHLESDPLLFKPVVEKLLHFSYSRINEVELYWPQIVHAYLTTPTFDFEKIFWLDELILSICSRSIHLALLLKWQLQGALEDSMEPYAPKNMQDKYARVIRLMLEMESQVVGGDRRELLQRDSETRSPRSRLPLPTEEQIGRIERMSQEIEEYRVQSKVREERSPDKLSSSRDLNKTNQQRYRAFSKFQQHLLAPRDGSDVLNSKDEEEESVEKQEPTRIFSTSTRRMSEAEKGVLAQHFADECGFVEQITEIAEQLRFLPVVSDRKKLLPSYLDKLSLPPMAYVPLVKATDPFEQIVRIPSQEGAAFSTKSRVPIMLIFEVIRGGVESKEEELGAGISPESAAPLREEEDDVEQMIRDESADAFQEEETKRRGSAPPSVGSKDEADENEGDMYDEAPSSLARRMEMDLNISNGELTEEAQDRDRIRREDLANAFGESWQAKRERLKQSSPYGHVVGWDIVSMMGKSNDDLRQEVFTLQLVQKFMQIFAKARLPLWLRFYRIISTSASTGLIETLVDAMSLDGLKKRDGYVSLRHHFERVYGPPGSPRFEDAKKNFIQSMAGYSLVCYLLQIKDRHNGNLMLDNEGHIIHIDYGFILGIAPGRTVTFESAPFKLTTEMVETMGGQDSEGFQEYVNLCTRGFLACQKHCDEICDLVEVMAKQSPYPCFAGKNISYVVSQLRSRFQVGRSREKTVGYVVSLIRWSNGNQNTWLYDYYQRMTNGIMP